MAKTKRTPSLQEQLLTALKIGHIDADACALVGISEETFYKWIRDFPEFSELVTKARLRAKDQSIRTIRSASVTQPQWAAWWLQRRGGKEFKAESELPPINVIVENQVLSPEAQKSLDQAIRYAMPKKLQSKSRSPRKENKT